MLSTIDIQASRGMLSRNAVDHVVTDDIDETDIMSDLESFGDVMSGKSGSRVSSAMNRVSDQSSRSRPTSAAAAVAGSRASVALPGQRRLSRSAGTTRTPHGNRAAAGAVRPVSSSSMKSVDATTASLDIPSTTNRSFRSGSGAADVQSDVMSSVARSRPQDHLEVD